MALTAVKKLHGHVHIIDGTVGDAQIATGVSQSKITNLTTDLAARAVKASDETISGNWTFSGTATLSNTVSLTNTTGSFTINTDKFTVAHATGNTVVAGTLNVAGTTTLTGNFAQTGTGTFSTGTGAISLNGDVTIGSGKTLTLDSNPTQALHAATKGYVDAVAQGLDIKGSVRVATTAALPAYTRVANVITADANGALAAIDGVTLVVNDRLLLKDGAAGADNGIYVVTAVGDGSNPFVLTRATDADTSAEVNSGMFTFVEEGTVNDNTGWALTTNNPITLNTTSLSFTQFTGASLITAGAGMTKTGNTLDVVAADSTITVNADSIQVGTGSLTNTHINASAAIAYSKLNLTGSIVNADINASAAIAWTKIDKTGSSIADLTTRNAENVVVTPSGNLAATDVEAALYELQGDINTINAKAWYVSYIFDSTNGQTTLAKPGGAPAIPANDENVMVFIDGRKVFGEESGATDWSYSVDVGGGGITFSALNPNQTVELRYFA